MLTDLLLAVVHHLLVFSLAALLAAEIVLVRHELSAGVLRLLARLDGAYGLVAMAVVATGVVRVVYGLKGWDYYATNHAFWAKMAAFALVGILSVQPTIHIARWRRQAAENPTYRVPAEQIARVRAYLRAEVFVFALIPIFAAAMARSFG